MDHWYIWFVVGFLWCCGYNLSLDKYGRYYPAEYVMAFIIAPGVLIQFAVRKCVSLTKYFFGYDI